MKKTYPMKKKKSKAEKKKQSLEKNGNTWTYKYSGSYRNEVIDYKILEGKGIGK